MAHHQTSNHEQSRAGEPPASASASTPLPGGEQRRRVVVIQQQQQIKEKGVGVSSFKKLATTSSRIGGSGIWNGGAGAGTRSSSGGGAIMILPRQQRNGVNAMNGTLVMLFCSTFLLLTSFLNGASREFIVQLSSTTQQVGENQHQEGDCATTIVLLPSSSSSSSSSATNVGKGDAKSGGGGPVRAVTVIAEEQQQKPASVVDSVKKGLRQQQNADPDNQEVEKERRSPQEEEERRRVAYADPHDTTPASSEDEVIYRQTKFNIYDVAEYWKEKTKLPCPHKFLLQQQGQQQQRGRRVRAGGRRGRRRTSAASMSPSVPNRNITLYHPSMSDRSGSVILRMILVYAYCYEHGFLYGGNIPRVSDPAWPRKQSVHESLINALGLGHVLKFQEPTQHISDDMLDHRQERLRSNELINTTLNTKNTLFDVTDKNALDDLGKIYHDDTEFHIDWYCIKHTSFSKPFLAHLRSQQQRKRERERKQQASPQTTSSQIASSFQLSRTMEEKKTTTTNLTLADTDTDTYHNQVEVVKQKSRRRHVVVHIRRGDTHPCHVHPQYTLRYQPNFFYLTAIQQLGGVNSGGTTTTSSSTTTKKQLRSDVVDDDDDENSVDVTIFSQSDSFENFDVFRSLGYNVILDGDMADAWIAMMDADVLILTPKSQFGIVPGLLNPNGNIYDRFGGKYHFHPIPKNIIIESQQALDILKSKNCSSWIRRHPEHLLNQTYW